MRPENQRMRDFLRSHGITARVKYLREGSLRGCWRLYDPDRRWDEPLRERLTALGFTNAFRDPLHRYEGNGGVFSVFVRGHEELVAGPGRALPTNHKPPTTHHSILS